MFQEDRFVPETRSAEAGQSFKNTDSMTTRNLPASALNGRPFRSNTAQGPSLGFLKFFCLLYGAGLILSCAPADPFSEPPAVSTTFFLPEIQVLNEHPTKASYEGFSDISRLDLFVFNDDPLMRLDSYSSLSRPSTPYISVTSSTGDKILVVLANCDIDGLDISDFWNYEALEDIRCSLKDEDPSSPVMSGECHFCAGADCYSPVQLTPVLSNICIDYLKCNFAGRGYRSTTLGNASVYLTNISGDCEVMRQDGFRITELQNSGALDIKYLDTMRHPEMIYRKITPGQWSPVNLYCYPNDSADGVLGSPHTRLVIQGDIDGRTYYYPIEVNQDGFGYSSGTRGISRNIKYSYSITVTKKGSTDPDVLVSPDEVVEQGWIKLHPGNLVTGTNGEKVHIWCEVYPEGTSLDICREDLDFDVERGIYDYEMDPDGYGVTLTLKENGTGMFTIDAGPPVNDGFLVIVMVNP